MKKIIAIVLCAILLFSVASCKAKDPYPELSIPLPIVEYVSYDTYEELKEKAPLIIKGKLIESHLELIDPNANSTTAEARRVVGLHEGYTKKSHLELFTVYKVKILSVVKGDREVGDIVEFKQLGRYFDQNDYDVDVSNLNDSSFIDLEDEKEYYLFLKTSSKIIPVDFASQYQSAYLVKDGELQKTHELGFDLTVDMFE